MGRFQEHWQYLNAHYGQYITAILLVATLLTVSMGSWLYLNPTTTTTTTQTDTLTSHTKVHTSATSVHQTTLFDKNETLRNSPVYLFPSMPRPQISLTTYFSDATQATVTHRVALKLTASYQDHVFWSKTTHLTNQTYTANATEQTTTTTLHIKQVRTQLSNIQQAVKGNAQIDASITIKTEYNTTNYTGYHQTQLPLSINSQTYSLGSGRAHLQQQHADSTTQTHTSRSPHSIPLLLSGLLFGVGASGHFLWRRRTTFNYPRWRYTLYKHRDWVSHGTLHELDVGHVWQLETIEDVVDAAIDAQSRVVYDETRGVCGVVAGDTLYYWVTPDSTWTPSQDTPEVA